VLRPFIDELGRRRGTLPAQRQADAVARDSGNRRPAGRLMSYPGVPPLSRVAPLRRTPGAEHPFPQGRDALRVFTTIATLGTPQDVTCRKSASCFFPADDASAKLFRRWAT
jgi:hypothetical protein